MAAMKHPETKLVNSRASELPKTWHLGVMLELGSNIGKVEAVASTGR
jgi:hypothetical protein